MPWCPDCKTEYDPGIEFCFDCGTALVEVLAPRDEPEDPVVVLEARSAVEAQVAGATLEAEGIHAFVQSPTIAIPGDNMVDDENPELEVLVSGKQAGAAAAILNAPPISEEELTEMEESDRADGGSIESDDETEES